MFKLFKSGNIKDATIHLSYLVALAKIDDDLDQSEIDLLFKIGKRFGLSDKEIKSILNSPVTEKIEYPRTKEAKFEQIYDLVHMMLADEIIHDKEMDFCIDMASKLGLEKNIVDDLVKKIYWGTKDGKTRDEIKGEANKINDL